ncbi:fumarylacetoacetate hydrolase family protein [Flavihumibacter profundi]|uniref:fumarylacetoacetate hydrolase family protein n=1 Tax=Flavihumibacter profundi TaxID=2716883 RepID=UPI001CC4476B|nr:fumarylacetoacetate hydrolase family protein [Flavihumibacter profundi]MBZ5856874.1 fumarylacetoacetate hydrolase family protein [Flavihumibacter profundi]
MKLLYFRTNNFLKLGIQTDHGIFDVDHYQQDQHGIFYSEKNIGLDDLSDLQAMLDKAGNDSRYLVNESGLTFGPCVRRPTKIICIGLNYRKHALESGMAIPTIPVVFTKYSNTLVDFGKDVVLGQVGKEFDYEVELGFVIGKIAKNISRENALDYVLGYCVANDLSCRDLQFRTSQWLMGKSLDHFLPLGKHLVTKDEIADPQDLFLQCKVNGEIRQQSTTADMIFSIAEIIEDLTRHFTLEPGDLILTGTPEGVAMGMPDKPWLKPGDIVEVAIEKLGSTINTMA